LWQKDPGFEPARPVMPANVRAHERAVDGPFVTDTITARCTDLFNVSYEVLLLVLERYFAHTTESDAQLGTLVDVGLGLMFDVIKPLGQLVTRLPVGAEYPGRTAGPSFELFYESDCVLPHQQAAWYLLEERLLDAAAFAERISNNASQLSEPLAPIATSLTRFANSLATNALVANA